jgi:hypothetical protein
VSVGLLVWYIVIAATGPSTSVYDPPAALTFYFFLFGLEAVALAASPGPRRGLQPPLVILGLAVTAARRRGAGRPAG